MPKRAHDQPSETSHVDGEVVIRGPGSIAGSMTPVAAKETSKRLAESAAAALDEPPPYEPE